MDLNKFLSLSKTEQIKYLENSNISTKLNDDFFELTFNKISDIIIFNNAEEFFFAVFFDIGGIFNENSIIFYEQSFNPIAKIVFSENRFDKRISLDYFFVESSLRGQGLGQFLLKTFLDIKKQEFGPKLQIFTNPYAFNTAFLGSKAVNEEEKIKQYHLEQFYLRNGLLLTEEPKKIAFNGEAYDPNCYNLIKL